MKKTIIRFMVNKKWLVRYDYTCTINLIFILTCSFLGSVSDWNFHILLWHHHVLQIQHIHNLNILEEENYRKLPAGACVILSLAILMLTTLAIKNSMVKYSIKRIWVSTLKLILSLWSFWNPASVSGEVG